MHRFKLRIRHVKAKQLDLSTAKKNRAMNITVACQSGELEKQHYLNSPGA